MLLFLLFRRLENFQKVQVKKECIGCHLGNPSFYTGGGGGILVAEHSHAGHLLNNKLGCLKISLGEKDEQLWMHDELLFGEISFSPLSWGRKTLEKSDVLISSPGSAQISTCSTWYGISSLPCRHRFLSECLLLTRMTVPTSLSHGGAGGVCAAQRAIHLVHRVWNEKRNVVIPVTQSGKVSLRWAKREVDFYMFESVVGKGENGRI